MHCLILSSIICGSHNTGADPGFYMGGGGVAWWQMIYGCADAHVNYSAKFFIIIGPTAGALSCYLSLIFKHSDTKWATQKVT